MTVSTRPAFLPHHALLTIFNPGPKAASTSKVRYENSHLHLFDEADVFLEKRTLQYIHRNALVGIFLRLLEYFQGILFLTTNRVETFDEAFQSPIQIALRYGELTPKARKAVFKLFIERVRVLEKIETMPFTEKDYTNLAKHTLNGRQIKNTVRAAQALAANKGETVDGSYQEGS